MGAPGSTQAFNVNCPNCGRPNSQGMQYCSWCGQQLTGASAIVPGMQQPPYPQPQQPYPPPYQQPQQPYPQPYQQPYPPPGNYQYPPTQPLNPQPYQQMPQQQPVYAQPPQMNFAMAPPPVVVINRPTKSVFVAFLLTFFFGPLGMFYSTVGGAIVMLLASIVLNGVFFLFVYPRFYLEYSYSDLSSDVIEFNGANLSLMACVLPAALWVICIIWGCAAAAAYNNRNQATIVR